MRVSLSDARVCELAVEIIQAQSREIDEVARLVQDINENGEVQAAEQAEMRLSPLPSRRSCARAPLPDMSCHRAYGRRGGGSREDVRRKDPGMHAAVRWRAR